MADRSQVVRLLSGGAALLAIAIGTFSSCSSMSKTATTLGPGAATTVPAATTVAGSSTSTPAGATAATSAVAAATHAGAAPAVDGAALLQTALASIAPGYHFTTTITVDGATVLTADGDRVADGTRLGVTQNNVSVQYIITPEGTWVEPDGGTWQKLDTPAATADPITSLQAPLAVAVDSVDGDTTNLLVTVTPASLGLTGDAPVVLAASIGGGSLKGVVYNSTVDGKAAKVQATIGPVVDGSPVVAPS